MKRFNNGLHEAGAYNRSSLAMQLSDAPSAVISQPMPLLMPRRQPAVETAAPAIFRGLDVAVERDRTSSATSFVIHFLLIVGLLRLGMMHTNILQPDAITVTPLHFTLYDPPPVIVPTPKISAGGGGGGAHELVEPTKGHLPPVVKMPVLAPQILRIDNPKLAVEPTMQVKMPENTNLPNIGVSQSPQVAMASQGSGSNSGFGFGAGGGIGVGHGNGVGAGTGGGYGGGVMSVGGGVSAPQVIHSVEPQFTETARQANYQGTVSIQLIVDSQGNPQDVRVVRHLDMGLDQKAVEAVKQYKFKPAMYQGHAVSVQMVVEVDFRLH